MLGNGLVQQRMQRVIVAKHLNVFCVAILPFGILPGHKTQVVKVPDILLQPFLVLPQRILVIQILIFQRDIFVGWRVDFLVDRVQKQVVHQQLEIFFQLQTADGLDHGIDLRFVCHIHSFCRGVRGGEVFQKRRFGISGRRIKRNSIAVPDQVYQAAGCFFGEAADRCDGLINLFRQVLAAIVGIILAKEAENLVDLALVAFGNMKPPVYGCKANFVQAIFILCREKPKEGSRTFARYRAIDDEMKKELVNLLK